MALNYIWIFFFVVAFVIGLVKLIFFGDVSIFPEMMNSTFVMAKTGFEISLGLTGVLTLWMGIMKIGEKGGVVSVFSKLVGPFFNKLFPSLGINHPAHGSILMNMTANMLNLDNAATPMGLKAMKEMQETNPSSTNASDAQIMFLVLNASGLTIIPISIMVYRAQLGAVNPSDIFIPILLATFFSTMAGLMSVAWHQKINLLDKTILTYICGITAVIAGIIWYFSQIGKDQIQTISSVASNLIIFTIIISFIVLAVRNKVNVYDSFIEGAKEGFSTAIMIIPYLIAILVAIGVFRTSGALEWMMSGITWIFQQVGINTDFTPALPTGLMKSLSGSGSRGMMVDVMKNYGADSFAGRVACTIQGSSDTTFYILAVYFGSVGIKNTRYALPCALIADFTGLVAAIFMAYLFFH